MASAILDFRLEEDAIIRLLRVKDRLVEQIE